MGTSYADSKADANCFVFETDIQIGAFENSTSLESVLTDSNPYFMYFGLGNLVEYAADSSKNSDYISQCELAWIAVQKNADNSLSYYLAPGSNIQYTDAAKFKEGRAKRSALLYYFLSSRGVFPLYFLYIRIKWDILL